MIQKRWSYLPTPDPVQVKSLSKAINVNEVLATLLIQRGIDDYDKAYSFFRPQLEFLHSPFAMKDMDKAVYRIAMALKNQERILIYGDYDVDGTTSVALLFSFFRDELNYPNIAFYIPDRYSEGYGISYKGVDFASDNDFSLVIALDCGIRAVEQTRYAKEKGIDFIICDHHLPGNQLPEVEAILNPKQPDCSYPFKELCGVGVGFKLLQAISQKLGVAFQNQIKYLDLVAVGTCSDIVPIIGENRIIVYYGLKQLNTNPRPGLKKLIDDTGSQRLFSVEDVVFMIGPRINAAGRIKHGSGAVELLIATHGDPLMDEMGKMLNENNLERRGLDKQITMEAMGLVDQNSNLQLNRSLVVYQPDWHKGVIGIVASRLVEKYYKPTIVLTGSEGKISGSARSVKGFDVHAAIEMCSEYLENFGGHMYAAGLTLLPENLELFSQKFEKIVSESLSPERTVPEIQIDAELDITKINDKFFSVLKQFAPFGPSNMNPVFTSDNVVVLPSSKIVGDNHLKLTISSLYDKSVQLSAIGFNLGQYYNDIIDGQPISIAYNLGENTWNGKTTIQLEVKDIRTIVHS